MNSKMRTELPRGFVIAGCLSVLMCVAGYMSESAMAQEPPEQACPTENALGPVIEHILEIGFTGDCPTSIAVIETSPSVCPVGLGDGCVVMGHGVSTVLWRSNPSGKDFAIFFDPTVKAQYKSSPKGCLRKNINPSKLATHIPPTDADMADTTTDTYYKYTIATMETGELLDQNCKTLDPGWIVEH
jgi:hypothetical protein